MLTFLFEMCIHAHTQDKSKSLIDLHSNEQCVQRGVRVCWYWQKLLCCGIIFCIEMRNEKLAQQTNDVQRKSLEFLRIFHFE